MTCIVAVEDGRRVWMGGDSAVTCDDYRIKEQADKVWKAGEFVLGAAGAARACSAFRFLFSPPPPPPTVGEFEGYFATDFIAEIRRVFDAQAIPYDLGAETDDGEDRRTWALLVGIRGHVYAVESDLSTGRSRYGYHAIGSGALAALGALHALGGDGLTAEQRCDLALKASAEFCASVAPPFKLVHT